MRVFDRPIAGFFFVILFPFFLLLGTIKFELFNPSFVFSSFEKNGVYQQFPSALATAIPNNLNVFNNEKQMYAQAIAAISPSLIQQVIEKNVTDSLHFFNGESKDLTIVIPLSEFHIPRGEDITWSSMSLQGQAKAQMEFLNGVSAKILVVWLALAALLLLLLFISGRVVLLIVGILTLLFAIAAKIFLYTVVANTPLKEPSQVFLVFLSKSILSDIAFSWMGVGVVCLLLWFVLGFIKRKKKIITKNVLQEGIVW